MTKPASSSSKADQTAGLSPVINLAALEPLYNTFEEPCRYRAPGKNKGDPAQIIQGRRPSYIPIAQNLRRYVKDWRDGDYPGASDTTRELLYFWFGEEHLREGKDGEQLPFQYYFCQREAIETFIYLYEIRGIRTLSAITAEFLGENSYDTALGVNPDDDRWPKYAFKMATGSGKTVALNTMIVSLMIRLSPGLCNQNFSRFSRFGFFGDDPVQLHPLEHSCRAVVPDTQMPLNERHRGLSEPCHQLEGLVVAFLVKAVRGRVRIVWPF